tara:strand:- start:277 stop:681 length:405 start_codon:yes stop_codon:yes gene_type:complete
MSEYEIWSVMNSSLIANAIYGASVFFILWVAFRAANQVRAEGSNVVIKSLVTLFGLGVILNGLVVSSILENLLQNTAYSLSQLDSISAASQSFVDFYGTGAAAEAGNIFGANPIMLVWWLVVTIIIMGRIWTKN